MDSPVSCDAAFSSQTSSPTSNPNEKELKNFYPKQDLIKSTRSKEKHESNTSMKPSKITISEVTKFSSSNWICKNLSCKAICKPEDIFCRRCSCCICYKFDENKDPSLWLVCNNNLDSNENNSCNKSCHIECFLENNKNGCADNFCCPSCGNISSILGCLKRQLETAKEARRIDILCYRIYLSYRLLSGTIKFEELNDIIRDVKQKIEKEVGPIDSASSARGLVIRLSISSDIQKLCSLAIKKLEEIIGSDTISNINKKEFFPAACRLKFVNVKSSSLVIVIKDPLIKSKSISNSISGYKLWYWKNQDLENQDLNSSKKEDPIRIQKDKTGVFVSDLQPCTEYCFKIVSFNEEFGDLGQSEAKCFTKSLKIIKKKNKIKKSNAKNWGKNEVLRSSGFKVRDLSKVLHQTSPLENPNSEKTLKNPNSDETLKNPNSEKALITPETEEDSCEEVPNLDLTLTLNLGNTSNPDPNPNPNPNSYLAIPLEESRTESMQNPNPNTRIDFPNPTGHLEENFEYCIRVIRWLECEGYFGKEFRMKFLTWFSLRSSAKQRKVVITFIRTFIDEPSSLAAQILDSFEEIVNIKKQKYGFCTKLWH